MGKAEAVCSGCANESEMKKKWNKVKVSDFISHAPELISTDFKHRKRNAEHRVTLKDMLITVSDHLELTHFLDPTQWKRRKKIIQRLYCARGKSGFKNLFSFCFGIEMLRNLNEMLGYKIRWFQNYSIMLHMKCVMQIPREDLFQWLSVLQIAWISWLWIDTKRMWVTVSSSAVSSHRLFHSLSPSPLLFYAVFVSRFLMQFTATLWVGGKWIE